MNIVKLINFRNKIPYLVIPVGFAFCSLLYYFTISQNEKRVSKVTQYDKALEILSEALYYCHVKKFDKVLYQAIAYTGNYESQRTLEAIEDNEFGYLQSIILRSIDEIKDKKARLQ